MLSLLYRLTSSSLNTITEAKGYKLHLVGQAITQRQSAAERFFQSPHSANFSSLSPKICVGLKMFYCYFSVFFSVLQYTDMECWYISTGISQKHAKRHFEREGIQSLSYLVEQDSISKLYLAILGCPKIPSETNFLKCFLKIYIFSGFKAFISIYIMCRKGLTL